MSAAEDHTSPALGADASVAAAPVEIVTPAQLYEEYAANEVATDQALKGTVIQFTAPVKSIDKDFTDSAVLVFSTGEDFSDMHAALNGSDEAKAGQLTRGQVVTVQCKTVRRIMESPMASDCTFATAVSASPVAQSREQPTDHQDDVNVPSACDASRSKAECDQAKLDSLLAKMDRATQADGSQSPDQQDVAADPQMQYAQAIQSAVVGHWTHPDGLPTTPRRVNIVQNPGGEVVSATVDSSCPYDDAGRRSVENAVLQTTLPYKGFESVFRRDLTFTFRAE